MIPPISKLSYLLTIVLLINFQFSICWWDAGHMLVTNIAYKEISVLRPEMKDFLEKLTEVMKGDSHKKIQNFIESSVWADITKAYGNPFMNTWHYVELPISSSLDKVPYIEETNSSSFDFIKSAIKALKQWNKEQSNSLDEQFEKSLYLRLAIHIIGDIHQPLHNCGWSDSNDAKKSDRGGNDFKINWETDKNINNLHKLWDSAFDSIYNGFFHPMTEEDFKILDKDSEEIMQEFPKEDLIKEIEDSSPLNWIKEAWMICKNNVYVGISKEESLNENSAYSQNNIKIARRQLALSGYRLVKVLIDTYDGFLKPNESKTSPFGHGVDSKWEKVDKKKKKYENLKGKKKINTF